MGGAEKSAATGGAGPRVLLVDDEDSVRRASARVLGAEGFEVVQAEDGRAALAHLERGDFDVVVSDVMMPHMSGLELLRAIRQRDLELPVILLTGMPNVAAALEAKRHGALHYLTKPVDNARLVLAVSRAERLRRFAVTKRMAMDALGSTLPRAGDLAGLEQSFVSALANLWMAYQPIVRASDRALYGYEALMRSKEASLPHPGAILDAAERLDRVHDVGRRVRALAPVPLVSAPEEAFLFVNMHSADLADETLVDPDSPLVRAASRVVLEITERATLEGIRGLEKRIAELREIGFRIAIDDLGAGYAGLTSFAQLDPDVVKLDMTLVRDVEKTPIKAKLVQSLCAVCRDLGVTVVAEGIETVPERDCIIELGCDLLQGYLLAKPGPAFPTFSWGG
jgi:EAL domain-containing protein (putative c-di-GMP-specific phosphodiesterase class I)